MSVNSAMPARRTLRNSHGALRVGLTPTRFLSGMPSHEAANVVSIDPQRTRGSARGR
jgi:hypothetical protein